MTDAWPFAAACDNRPALPVTAVRPVPWLEEERRRVLMTSARGVRKGRWHVVVSVHVGFDTEEERNDGRLAPFRCVTKGARLCFSSFAVIIITHPKLPDKLYYNEQQPEAGR